jgi:hypothetical protein
MTNNNEHYTEHHAEDHTVCYRVGLFFLAVLAVIVLIALAN